MLAADTVCWHCGQARTEQKEVPRAKAQQLALEPLPFSSTAVFAYGGLTLAVLIGMIFVMRSLAQQPLIAINTSRDRDRSWSTITDNQQRFTLDLPPEWTVYEPVEGDGFSEQLAAYDVWETAVSPLDPATIQLVAVAPEIENRPLRLLAVARNIQLHELSYLQIQQLIEQDGYLVHEVEESTSFFGSRQIHLRVEADDVQCFQQYTLEPENSHLLSICISANLYLREVRATEAIQAGFQTLMKK